MQRHLTNARSCMASREKGWHMEPQFENLGMMDWYTSDTKDIDFVMRCCRCEKI